MQLFRITPATIPMDLLLEADPSETSIRSYLDDAWCFVAKDKEQIVGVCIAKAIGDNKAEIFNLSVYPSHQQQGIGTALLRFTLKQLAEHDVARVELGTGTFGYQLTFYQRVGFRIDAVIKDHFLDNYPEAIFENGIQHKDMLRLYINLF